MHFCDLADVEIIDVVKGPASTLYGRTEPGGLINIITKQPLPIPYLSLEATARLLRTAYRTQLDTGGPLSADGSVLYRFNAAWEKGGILSRGFQQQADISGARGHPRISRHRQQFPDTSSTCAVMTQLILGLPVIGADMPPVPVERRVEQGGEVHTRDVRTGVRGW